MTNQTSAMATAKLNVGILAANELLHRGLDTVLSQVALVGAVAHCRHPAEVDRLLAAGDVDVLILAGPWTRPPALGRTRILMLLDEASAADPSAASLDADGFLFQQELTQESLSDAIRRVAAGETPMPGRLARHLISQVTAPGRGAVPARRLIDLTSREKSTLDLLYEGLSNKQIARRLGISEHGVKRLVASVLLKLDSPNRTSAVVTAIKAGLIDHTA
ncbi:helix-turn-helix transcriptional regulator [Actinomadura harenae]|nr:response regulator transcription factor [Actinomadura harenae]